jgi:hypothetical protein
MGVDDRKRVVLEYMADTGAALPPKALYRNLRFHRNATFSYSAMNNYLVDFVRDGYARRVEKEPLEDRKLVDIPLDEEGRAYYIITEAGRDQLRSSD